MQVEFDERQKDQAQKMSASENTSRSKNLDGPRDDAFGAPNRAQKPLEVLARHREHAAEKSHSLFPAESDKPLRDIYAKYDLSFHGGPKLTDGEKADLAGAADAVSRRSFPQDTICANYSKKEWLNCFGNGPALTDDERLDYHGRSLFPKDSDQVYRDLVRRQDLSDKGELKLTAAETCDLESKKRFPEERDGEYRTIYRKELLNELFGGPALTKNEAAALRSHHKFPETYEAETRNLYKKDLLAKDGGPALTTEEKQKLFDVAVTVAAREFPRKGDFLDENTKFFQTLATNEWCSKYSDRPQFKLSNEEQDLLQLERLRRSLNDIAK